MTEHTPTRFWQDQDKPGIIRWNNNPSDGMIIGVQAPRFVACLNFFHGRELATENIPEGGFWEMVAMVRMVAASPPTYEVGEHAAGLLTKLGIEP